MYLNRVFIAGNLTRDPELTKTPSGLSVCKLSVATNKVWKNQNGEKQESVEYHNIVAFKNTAETIAKFFKKGQPIWVDGELKTSSWDDKETGKKAYRTEIIANSFQFVGGAPEKKKQPSGEDYPDDENGAVAAYEQEAAMDHSDLTGESIREEDIPY